MDRSTKVLLTSSDVFHYTSPLLDLGGWGIVHNVGMWTAMCCAWHAVPRAPSTSKFTSTSSSKCIAFVTADDDAFEQYRKRMMLGYKHRPNPLGNPRKSYY